MDVLAAYREVGSYRGAAAICGTTHKRVRRIVEAHESASFRAARPARKDRGHCGEAVSGCVRATVVDGCSYRLNMIVVEDCVYDRHEATWAMNLFDIDQKYGDVVSLDEVFKYFDNL